MKNLASSQEFICIGFPVSFALSAALKAQFAVRTETDKLKYCGIGLAVNQNQVGLDVAVTVVFPIAA
jgi:hypothetical protein